MADYPRYALAGSNQYPAVATAIPSQFPVIEIVDGTGSVVTNLGNGPADGTWINMTLINGFTAGDVTPQYMKDSRNVIHLRGKVVAPGGATACWTLPAGYAPLIAAGAVQYFNWPNGGGNPSYAASVNLTTFSAAYTAAGTAGLAGAVGILDRVLWQGS